MHITWKPAARSGTFDAFDENGEFLCCSRQPFLDGARVLMARGADPSEKLTGGATGAEQSLSCRSIAVAAGLTICEGNRRPYFRQWSEREFFPQRKEVP